MIRGFVFALLTSFTVFAASAESYTTKELMKYYRMDEPREGRGAISEDLAIKVLPPPPPPFIGVLPPQTDPLMKKLISLMSDAEIDHVVKNATAKLNDYWTSVFRAQGKVFPPASVSVYTSSKGDNEVGSYFDPEKGKNGRIFIDRREERENPWIESTSAAINADVAHEMGHYVVNVLNIEWRATKKAKSNRGLCSRQELNTSPVQVCIELQADFLAGISLKGSELLYKGNPEEIYYNAAGQGDDFEEVTGNARLSIQHGAFTHGTGKDRAALIYEGMQTGDVHKGLSYLGTTPDWNRLQKIPKKKQPRRR
ncbi:MAG: neutral zinc metallopeptidase [bacterium]|nr:neutral zinc metallopeptidase [bacterium]